LLLVDDDTHSGSEGSTAQPTRVVPPVEIDPPRVLAFNVRQPTKEVPDVIYYAVGAMRPVTRRSCLEYAAQCTWVLKCWSHGVYPPTRTLLYIVKGQVPSRL
jgi:hypothetical protein